MTKRLPVTPAPGPLEGYSSARFAMGSSALAPSAKASGATWRGFCSPPSAIRHSPPWLTPNP